MPSDKSFHPRLTWCWGTRLAVALPSLARPKGIVVTFPAELAWIPKVLRPMAELCSGERAHLFVCALTVCHMDAILRRQDEARRFLAGNMGADLAVQGIDVIAHEP